MREIPVASVTSDADLEENLQNQDVLAVLQELREGNERTVGLIERFYRETQCEAMWQDAPQDFLKWLGELDVSMATFGRYRKMLADYAEFCGFINLADQIDQLRRKRKRSGGGRREGILQKLQPPEKVDHKTQLKRLGHSKENRNNTRSLRSQYADHVDSRDIKTIGDRLLVCTGKGNDLYKAGTDALCFLQMGMLTGVRPVEWIGANLHSQKVCEHNGAVYRNVLEVTTAKRKKADWEDDLLDIYIDKKKQDDLFFEKRFLILDGYRDSELQWIGAFIRSVREHEHEFEKWYTQCRQTMARAVEKSMTLQEKWKGNTVFSIYSSRHIFASEVRRSGRYTKQDLAAMLGHDNTRSQKYYGDIRNNANRMFGHSLPRPWPGVSEMVRKKDAEHAIEQSKKNKKYDIKEGRI